MNECENGNLNTEFKLSDLLLEETPLLDQDEVHYVHFPHSKSKKIYQHNLDDLFRLLNVVKIDGVFLAKQVESLANNQEIIANDFNVFESGNYERLTGVIESSCKVNFHEPVSVKPDVFDVSFQTLKTDLTGLNVSHNPLPDVVSEWEIEGPIIQEIVSNTSLSTYANIETLYEQYDAGLGGEKEVNLDFESLDSVHESLIEHTNCVPTKSLEHLEKENCSFSSFDFEIQHQKIQVCDDLVRKEEPISASQMLKLTNQLPVLRDESSEEDEVQSSSEVLYDDHARGSISYSNTSGELTSWPSSSLDLCKVTPELTDTTSDISNSREVVVDKLRSVRDTDQDLHCHLTHKDTFNYSNAAQDGNNLVAIKSACEFIIIPENVKAKVKANLFELSDEGKKCVGFSNEFEKCRDEEIINKDSKIIPINSSSLKETLSKSEEIYEEVGKYREIERKASFPPLVRDRFRESVSLKTFKTGEDTLKETCSEGKRVSNVETFKSDALSDGNNRLPNLNCDSNAQRSLSEMELKATKLNGEEKKNMFSDFSAVRENVLAKFNDWVIDIDWIGDDDEEVDRATTPSLSGSSYSNHSQNFRSIVPVKCDGEDRNESKSSASDVPNLSRKWVFKELSLHKNKTGGSQTSLTSLDAFMNLRQGVLPKLKSAVDVNAKATFKKRKINSDGEDSQKPPASVLQISRSPLFGDFKQETYLSPPFGAFKPTKNVHSEIKLASKLPDCKPVKIIGSSESSKETELICLLELRYNLRIVVRESTREVPTRNDLHNEMFCVPEFIIDEKSAVVLFPLRNLNVPQQFLKLKKKINALSLRHSRLYVLLIDKTNNNPCIHPDVLKMYSKLSGLSSHLNMVVKDYKIKLLICKNLEEAARYVRRFVDFSLQNMSEMCEDFKKREWLLPAQSLHERFLSNFPTLSSFHAQMMLASVTLRTLMKMSLDELLNTFPTIPQKFLENFHKLAHKKVSTVVPKFEKSISSEIERDHHAHENLTRKMSPEVESDDENQKAEPKRFKFKIVPASNNNCSNQIDLSSHVSPPSTQQNFRASSQVFNTYVTNNYSNFAGIRQEAFTSANTLFDRSQSLLYSRQQNVDNANRFRLFTANEGWIQNANYSAVDLEPPSSSAHFKFTAFDGNAKHPSKPPPIPYSWQRCGGFVDKIL